jgi:hypothetical protein
MQNERELRKEEIQVIAKLVEVGDSRFDPEFLNSARVVDMKDGGMGSIRFASHSGSKYEKTLAEAEYTDSDDVLVSISLNADQHGNLFELDFWKVNFSPLDRYPTSADLQNVRKGN